MKVHAEYELFGTHHKWRTGLFLSHELFMILMHLKFEGHRTRICVLILNHRRERLIGLSIRTGLLSSMARSGQSHRMWVVTGAHICSRTPSSQTGIMFTKVTSAPKQPEAGEWTQVCCYEKGSHFQKLTCHQEWPRTTGRGFLPCFYLSDLSWNMN